jgi:hypothetical protein
VTLLTQIFSKCTISNGGQSTLWSAFHGGTSDSCILDIFWGTNYSLQDVNNTDESHDLLGSNTIKWCGRKPKFQRTMLPKTEASRNVRTEKTTSRITASFRKHFSSNKMTSMDTWCSTSTFWHRGYRAFECKLSRKEDRMRWTSCRLDPVGVSLSRLYGLYAVAYWQAWSKATVVIMHKVSTATINETKIHQYIRYSTECCQSSMHSS